MWFGVLAAALLLLACCGVVVAVRFALRHRRRHDKSRSPWSSIGRMGHRPTVGGLFHRQGTYVAGGDRMMRPPSTCWVPAAANRFACFLSHFKAESGSDARYLRDLLQRMLGCPVFLDSSDLTDLRALFTDGVHRSDVLVLLATEKLLTRPWCILELWEAVSNLSLIHI